MLCFVLINSVILNPLCVGILLINVLARGTYLPRRCVKYRYPPDPHCFSVECLGARSYSTHDTLVITDGQSNCGADILTSSRTLQQRSNVYALAIGLSSDRAAASEITSLVSNRDPRHLFSLANFRDFRSMVQTVKDKQEASQCQPIVVNS